MTSRNPSIDAVWAMIGRGAAVLGLGATCWGCHLVWDLNTAIVTQTLALAEIRRDLMGGMSDRYRAADATRDFRLRDEQIASVAGRVGRLEGVVSGKRPQ